MQDEKHTAESEKKIQANEIKSMVEAGQYEDVPEGEYAQFSTAMIPAVKKDKTLARPQGKVWEKAVSLWRGRPRFSDEGQRRAGTNIVRFFAAVLVLTLIARGTAGATLAKVETTKPQSGEIVEKVSGSATVKSGGNQQVLAPAGLTLKENLVGIGQKVKAGDPLAKFDMEEVDEKCKREAAALKELQVKLQRLSRGEILDSTTLQTAQRAVARAQEDYNNTKTQGESDVSAQRTALTNAETAAQAANTALENLKTAGEDPESEAYKAAESEAAAAALALAEKQQALSTAETAAAANLLLASRGIEDAQSALAAAQTADTSKRQEASDKTAENSVEIAKAELDIEEQSKKVSAINDVQSAGGVLQAATGGTVLEVLETGVKTEENKPILHLSDENSAYEAEILLDKKDAEKLSPGNPCEVEEEGGSMYYHAIANGTVHSIAAPNEDGRVKVTVRLPQGKWKQGQVVRVQMVHSKQNYTTCVPRSALHSGGDSYYVLTLMKKETVLGIEQVAVKVPVTIKAQDDKMAAVEGAIGEWDQVVSGSSKTVQEGDRVRVNDTGGQK